MISAPFSFIADNFKESTHTGTQTVAATPNILATVATARPWLPLEQVTTPRDRSSGVRLAMQFKAPLTLKDPVACKFSNFR